MNINGNYYDIAMTGRFNEIKEKYYIKDINVDGIQELIFEGSNFMVYNDKFCVIMEVKK